MADDRPNHPPPGAYAAGDPGGFPQQVVLQPAPPAARPPEPAKPPEPDKDGLREIVETIVFVVVLVLMLKTFLAEAFVIPTGSMATTLLGYHRHVTCNQCAFPFLVNASPETEEGTPVVSCHCPNCGYKNTLRGQPGGMP